MLIAAMQRLPIYILICFLGAWKNTRAWAAIIKQLNFKTNVSRPLSLRPSQRWMALPFRNLDGNVSACIEPGALAGVRAGYKSHLEHDPRDKQRGVKPRSRFHKMLKANSTLRFRTDGASYVFTLRRAYRLLHAPPFITTSIKTFLYESLAAIHYTFQHFPLCWDPLLECSQNAPVVASSDLQVVLKINSRLANASNRLLPTALQRQKKTSYKTRQMCFSDLRSFFSQHLFCCLSGFLTLFSLNICQTSWCLNAWMLPWPIS